MRRRMIVGVSGASGTVLALEMLRILKRADVDMHLVVSAGARLTAAYPRGSSTGWR